MLENRKRDRALEGKSEEEIEALKAESRIQGFEDITDGKNVSCSCFHMLLCLTSELTRSPGFLPLRFVMTKRQYL